MAVQTFFHSSYGMGAVVVEFDINDANWRVSQVRCINNSVLPAKAFIYESGELVFTAVGQPNQTTSWNVVGVQLGWQEPYWNDITQQWEAGGIEMGNYIFSVRYPAEAE